MLKLEKAQPSSSGDPAQPSSGGKGKGKGKSGKTEALPVEEPTPPPQDPPGTYILILFHSW